MSSIDCSSITCTNCTTPKATNYSTGIMNVLAEWLSGVTCIPWCQSHVQAGEVSQQHGILRIVEVEASTKNKETTKIIDEDNHCRIFSKSFKYQLELKVIHSATENYPTQSFEITPLDILQDVIIQGVHLTEYVKLLEQQNIRIVDFSNIIVIDPSVEKDDKCCWYNQASMNIELCVNHEISRTQSTIKDICVQICDYAVKCPEEHEECQ